MGLADAAHLRAPCLLVILLCSAGSTLAKQSLRVQTGWTSDAQHHIGVANVSASAANATTARRRRSKGHQFRRTTPGRDIDLEKLAERGRLLNVEVLGFMDLPFIPESSRAPLASVAVPPRDLYGTKHCYGDENFLKLSENLPKDFCVFDQAWGYDFPGHFDEFATERLLLSRWVRAPEACGAEPPLRPCGDAPRDVVVAPSLFMHILRDQVEDHGAQWKVVWSFNGTEHDMYWNALRKIYVEQHNSVGGTPHIVVHHSYAFDAPFFGTMLHHLTLQPKWFADKVIIVAIESDLPNRRMELLHSNFTPSPELLLKRRWGGQLDHPTKGTPTIVSLPYPVPVFEPVSFTQPAPDYDPEKPRRIAVLFSADNDRGGHGANSIRSVIRSQMLNAGAVCSEHTCLFCSGGNSTPDGDVTPGTSCPEAFGNASSEAHAESQLSNMWDFATSSTFCLEPAGDTLTRSHFFVSLLAGCIPVIFDGGHDDFSAEQTSWPFRRLGEEEGQAITYSNFTMKFEASEVKAGTSPFLQVLLLMPSRNPERIRALREGVDRAAAYLRYSLDECGGVETDCDAFARFRHFLRRLRGKTSQPLYATAVAGQNNVENAD